MSTVALARLSAPSVLSAPEFRRLAVPAIRDLAGRLAVSLFVGRPDPALNPPPVDLPAVNGR